MVQISSMNDELQKFNRTLNGKVDTLSTDFKDQADTIHSELMCIAVSVTNQQIQVYFLFVLVTMSFVLGAGLSAFILVG